MRCPQCGHENAAEMKFCGECGTRLAVLCRQCGARLAARMEQLAAPGSIQLTAETLRLVAGVQSGGPAAPVELFGGGGPRPPRTRLEAAARRGLTRFVGRSAELDQLRDTLDQESQGRGQVVSVVGEPGVGKSRLFWEFTHSHRLQGWLVLESTSVSYGKATSYLPVIDLLKRARGAIVAP